MTCLRSVVCLLSLTILSNTCVAEPTAKIKSAAKKVSQIVAHRGASAQRPEGTLVCYRKAIKDGATAIEIDVRTTKDGVLVSLHDASLDRTTNGSGPIEKINSTDLKKLDAGSWFDAKYKSEHVPTIREILKLAKGKIDVLLDLKETGSTYTAKVVGEIRKHGEPKRIIVGVRSVEQAKQFRKLLPEAQQIGLIPDTKSIEAFAATGTETIRLWPRWLTDEKLVPRVRAAGAKLHLNGRTGTKEEIIPLLNHAPDSLSSDNPERLLLTLKNLGR